MSLGFDYIEEFKKKLELNKKEKKQLMESVSALTSEPATTMVLPTFETSKEIM